MKMSSVNAKKESTSAADEENMNSSINRASSPFNLPFEESSEIGSGDAKYVEKEGNLSSNELEIEKLAKTAEITPSLDVKTVAKSEKYLTDVNINAPPSLIPPSLSQVLEIESDAKLDTETVHSIMEKPLESLSDDKEEVLKANVDEKQTVDNQNDSLEDELQLRWEDDASEEALSEDALKLLDQELGIDDIIATSEVEANTAENSNQDMNKSQTEPENVISNDQLRAEAKITDTADSNDKEDQMECQTLPEDSTVMDINDPKEETSSSKEDQNVTIEKMEVDLTDNSNIDNEIECIEGTSKIDIDLTCSSNSGNTEDVKKDYKFTSLIVEEKNTVNKDVEDSNVLLEVPIEGLSEICKETKHHAVENPDEVNVVINDSNQVEVDVEESADETEKQDVIENIETDNVKNTEIIIADVLIGEIDKTIENQKIPTDNPELPKESKGMKTDLGLNKPDVMLEIPTQELIDIDEFDDVFDDKEMHSIEKEVNSIIKTKFEDNMTKTDDKSLDVTKLSVTEIVKEKDEEKQNLIANTAEESSDIHQIQSVDNLKPVDSNLKPNEKPLLSDEKPSTSKDVINGVQSVDYDPKSQETNPKSADSGLKSHNSDVKSIDSNLKPDEQPSTSKIDDNDETEVTDSLLAESSRVIDDDDDHDEDRDDDSDDFDQDDESSNHMTGEHSEESNPPPSENEPEKDEECEKETALEREAQSEDNEEQMDIVDDIVCEEAEIGAEADDVTTTLNEETSDIKSPIQNVETTPPEAEAREIENAPENDNELRLKTLLLKNDKDSSKESPSKNARLSVANNNANILSFVDLGDSDEELQESNKEKTKPKADGTDDSIDITEDGNKTEEKPVAKPKPAFKMTKLNTSEVSIKTGVSTKPPLIIPEITNTSVLEKKNAKTQLDTEPTEVFSLDTDSEDEKDIPQEITEDKHEISESPKLNTKCINPVCTSKSSEQHYIADAIAARFYSSNKKRAICSTCRAVVLTRNQSLIEGIKSLTPLLELNMEKPTNTLVEISDSESEDESEILKEFNEVIGDKEAGILNEKLVDMINDAWLKFNMDDRLKDSEDYITKNLQKLEDEGTEVNKLLDDCQVETDRIRKELYNAFYKPAKQLPPIAIYDTPIRSYTCLEKDAPLEKGTVLLKGSSEETSARKPNRVSESTVDKKEDVKNEDTKTDKQDDDRDVSVVLLSAESAPTDLPPPGEVVRPPLRPGLAVHAMRNAFGSWLRGRILDILPKTPTQQYTNCRVKFDHSVKNPCKVLPARCIAYQEPCNVRMTIGTRCLALFRDSMKKESFYSGVVAEIPNPVNSYRYLVFFDDGYAQYVKHQDTRLVCETKSCVWEEVHPFIRDFVKDYLYKYPERPMVRLHAGQRLNTEWNGKWWSSVVLQVDASLAHVHFEEDNRTEWIYRGSTRLAPLYLELQAAERHRTRLPRSKAQFRSNMPYVEYMRSEDQTKAIQQDEALRRQRAVAKKSTTVPQAAPVEDKPDNVTSRVVYYTPKNAVRPKKMVTHTCGPHCKRTDVLSLKELRTYNPLAKPLLSGWERVQVRYRGTKAIMYRAPCGRRLRDIKELHKYLRLTDSELPVDLFDFNVNTHCLAEFVLHKYNVMKKDLSHGKENVPVPCVNYYDDSLPEFCSYNTERTPTAGVPLNLDPEFLCGCDCEDDCEDKSKCACWRMTLEGARTIGLESPDVGYVYRRLPEPLPSGIYECNSRCKCKSTCLNRVAQQPLQLKLQVFKTLKRGWGIRALNDVPKGSFLCVYAGNLLTDATANLDGLNEGDEYLAELDYIEVVEQMKEGYEEDIPEADKKLDKKESNIKSESEEEEATESEEEQNDSDKMDDDFQPGFIGMGLTDFDKRLRKRNKKKQGEDKEKEKEGGGQKTENCITISDDEEVREPSRFTAQAGMGDKEFVSRYKSVRTLFGEDEACYIMDAKVQGNIGRYLNHSCQPNVFVQNVFVDTHDPRFPWVAFFALAHIRAGTELTWNYNYDIGSVPGKVLYCYCGAANCRGRLL